MARLFVLAIAMVILGPVVSVVSLAISGINSRQRYFAVAGLCLCLLSLKDVIYIVTIASSVIVGGFMGYVPF